MKLHYYPETDSLYIELNERPSADSHEVADNLGLTSMRLAMWSELISSTPLGSWTCDTSKRWPCRLMTSHRCH